ncbi:hypothetical protein PFISCL1PPCAC_29233, partial [Pristionchus fissidentatus]
PLLSPALHCCELLLADGVPDMELPTIMLHSPQAFSVDEENGLITVDGKTVEKKYYCQRCLNHDLLYPRKGHKTECIFAACPCAQCAMVEQRRQLNNMLSKKRVVDYPHIILNGRKVRDPKCARCYAHGIMSRLRGHKKDCCEFARCTCEACLLVDTRRNLMARQIRLRRLQVRSRKDGAVAAAAAAAAVAAAVAAPPDPEVRLPSVEALESIPAIVRPVAVVPPPITISPIML